MYIDAHVHLHEFMSHEIEEFIQLGVALVAVSDDYDSSIKTLELRDSFPEHIKACVGIHPWNIPEEGVSSSLIESVLDLAKEADCIGEVGVDLKFAPKTFQVQREIFRTFVREAVRLGKPVNVHAAGAWKEALAILTELNTPGALIHWYTGPEELLQLFAGRSYYISLNPAMKIQRKHLELAAKVDLRVVLTESDGPYEYRGLRLSPKLVPELVARLAALRNVSVSDIEEIIWENFNHLFAVKKKV